MAENPELPETVEELKQLVQSQAKVYRRRRYRKPELCAEHKTQGVGCFSIPIRTSISRKTFIRAIPSTSWQSLRNIYRLGEGVQLIWRYGLYSSRIKGAWDSMLHVVENASAGWKIQHERQTGTSDAGDYGLHEDADVSDDSPDTRAYRKAWVQRFAAGDIANPRLCAKLKTQGPIIVEDLRNGSYGLPEMRIGNESYRCYSGTGGNRSHSQASRKAGSASSGV